jgi:hypothetical protein
MQLNELVWAFLRQWIDFDDLFADSKQSRDFVSLLIEPVTNCENIIALCLLEK